jgi:molybdopterin-binding protein
MKISARNRLKGRVVDVVKGATTAHVRIDIGNGAIVTASITNEAVDELGLKAGAEAYAVVKASDVMVAVDGASWHGRIAGLEIARLRRGDGREERPVRFQVEERRAVEAIQAAHQHRAALDRFQLDDGRADRIGPYRRAQRKRAMRLAVAGRALQEQITPRLVQPIEHLQALESCDALQGRHPGIKDFDAAQRPVMPPLTRRFHARRPGCENAADENQAGIAVIGRIFEGDLVFADLVFSHHRLLSLQDRHYGTTL